MIPEENVKVTNIFSELILIADKKFLTFAWYLAREEDASFKALTYRLRLKVKITQN